MPIAADTAALLAVIGLALAAVGLAVGMACLVRLKRLRRDYTLLQGTDGEASFVDAVARKVEQVEGLRVELAQANGRIENLRKDVSEAIRHIAVVRYDAFGDMGGRLSFSAALLDDYGDGMVLTSIHGRTETRSYSKGVKDGASELVLSPEEEQAVAYAMRTTSGRAPAGR